MAGIIGAEADRNWYSMDGDEVIPFIRNAESILIFGPGEAKTELKNHLERHKLTGRIAGIETADRMTDRQIAAKVRRFFLKQSSAIASQ